MRPATAASQATGVATGLLQPGGDCEGEVSRLDPRRARREPGLVERGEQRGPQLAGGIGLALEVVRAVGDDARVRLAHVRRVEVRDDEHRLPGPRQRSAGSMTNGFETGQSSSGVSKQPSERASRDARARLARGRPRRVRRGRGRGSPAESGRVVLQLERSVRCAGSDRRHGRRRTLLTRDRRRGQVRVRRGTGAAEGRDVRRGVDRGGDEADAREHGQRCSNRRAADSSTSSAAASGSSTWPTSPG